MVRPTSVAARDDARRQSLLDELIPLFHAEGFLVFSLEDLARRLGCSKSTLYVVAPSKEQIIQATVRESFRRSTDAVERRVAAEPDRGRRISVYLDAIAEELAPAGPTYFADLDAYEPAREVYRNNVRLAAQRVKELVEASGRRRLDRAAPPASARSPGSCSRPSTAVPWRPTPASTTLPPSTSWPSSSTTPPAPPDPVSSSASCGEGWTAGGASGR